MYRYFRGLRKPGRIQYGKRTAKEEAAEGENDIIHLNILRGAPEGNRLPSNRLLQVSRHKISIKVEAEFIDNANYTAKLNINGGWETHLMWPSSAIWLGIWGAKGQLLDLKPYLENGVDLIHDILGSTF